MTRLIGFCVFLIIGKASVANTEDELGNLMDSLLRAYNSGERPGGNKTVIINHQYVITRLVELDMQNQILTLDVWEMLNWVDERLVWDPKFFPLAKIRVSPSRIWMPDIEMYNSVEPPTEKFQTSVHVDRSGQVTYVPSRKIKTYCNVADRVAVGNRVNCSITVGSWLFNDSEVDIQAWNPEKHQMDLSVLQDNNRDWEIVSTDVRRIATTYACCPEEYSKLEYTVTLIKKNRPVLI